MKSCFAAVWSCSLLLGAALLASSQTYFGVHVVDQQSGRGVPLVKVRANNQDYYTDSSGLAAINTTGIANQSLGFSLTSYGYTSSIWPLQVVPGAIRDVTISRTQLAERLYRVTGKGICQDTLRLGQSAPIANPLINANVKGQDSVQTAIYKNQLHWFWGDTLYDVGFGNFRTSGATSQLPAQGGSIRQSV